jgi:hypothetical protein
MLPCEHNFKAGDLVTVVRGVYYGNNESLADRGIGIIVSEEPDNEEEAGHYFNSCVCVLLGGERIDIHHKNLDRVV